MIAQIELKNDTVDGTDLDNLADLIKRSREDNHFVYACFENGVCLSAMRLSDLVRERLGGMQIGGVSRINGDNENESKGVNEYEGMFEINGEIVCFCSINRYGALLKAENYIVENYG